MINIKVLGTGCAKCQRVEQHAVAALETLAEGDPALEATIQHVTDLAEIIEYPIALGRGVPVVLAGTFTGVLKRFHAFGRWSAVIEKVSGVIILGVGLYFLWIA